MRTISSKIPVLSADDHVIADALAWAEEWASKLRQDERPMSGGWPGTMSEARHRVMGCSKNAWDTELVVRLTKLSYATAKKAWLVRAVADRDR